MLQSGPVQGFGREGTGTNRVTKKARRRIQASSHHCGGFPRKPGMRRDALMFANQELSTPALRNAAK